METVSCIIPAYNEEKGIAGVLSVVAEHPLITEVIVVDDGSTDRTKDIVHGFPDVRLITNNKNCGKTVSVCRGILESSHPYLFLIDADLTGVTQENITAILEPVLKKETTMTLSIKSYYPWRTFGFDPITGERVMPRSLLVGHIPEMKTIPPFALEIFINRLIIENHIPFVFVPWLKVSQPIKPVKRGFITGVLGEIGMWRSILSYMPFHKLARQFYILWRMSR